MPGLVPTPVPTDADFLDALSLCDGAVDEALAAIVELLRAQMPGRCAALNAAKNWTGEQAITPARDYRLSPGVVTEQCVNTILVAARSEASDHGPGAVANTSQVVVYSIGERIEIDSQFQAAHRRASAFKGILHCYLNGFVNADGLYLWRQLKLTGFSFLPSPNIAYAGIACYYEMFQPPGENFWADL